MSLISLPTSRLVEMRIAVHGRAMDAPSVIGLSQHEFVEMACSVYSRIIADRGRRCGVYSGAFAFAVRTSVVVGPLAGERAEARPDARRSRILTAGRRPTRRRTSSSRPCARCPCPAPWTRSGA